MIDDVTPELAAVAFRCRHRTRVLADEFGRAGRLCQGRLLLLNRLWDTLRAHEKLRVRWLITERYSAAHHARRTTMR